MHRLPTNVLARIFSHLPTLDLGRIASVSRSWNLLLSNSPKLWVHVEVADGVSSQKALGIIKIISDRSQCALQTVSFPDHLEDFEVSEVLRILGPSRATLRKIVLDFSSTALTMQSHSQASPLSFFMTCPSLEELYLDGESTFSRAETSPGILTHFSCDDFGPEISQSQIQWLSKLRSLEISDGSCSSFIEVLSECSELEELGIDGNYECEDTNELQDILGKLQSLKALRLARYHSPCCGLNSFSAPNLEVLEITVSPESTFGPFKKLKELYLRVPQFDLEEEDDKRLELLDCIVKFIESHQETLEKLELGVRWDEEAINFSVDPILEVLRVNIVLGAPLPNLSELSLPSEIKFNFTLLAEILLSRRLLSEGYSILTPKGVRSESHRCSGMILYLEEEDHEEFDEAERKVLSRCSKWMREAAGETTLHFLG